METLTEYANRVGATLKPTCLAAMPVMSAHKNTQPNNFFGAFGRVVEWLEIKDPSGGLNKSGTWPAKLMEENGVLTVSVTTG